MCEIQLTCNFFLLSKVFDDGALRLSRLPPLLLILSFELISSFRYRLPETWQWAELSGYGDLPPAREFAAGVSASNGKIVM
jgi:hypothetical protein